MKERKQEKEKERKKERKKEERKKERKIPANCRVDILLVLYKITKMIFIFHPPKSFRKSPTPLGMVEFFLETGQYIW
jgi:hypothetical protein